MLEKFTDVRFYINFQFVLFDVSGNIICEAYIRETESLVTLGINT